jgi:hypothetical protein
MNRKGKLGLRGIGLGLVLAAISALAGLWWVNTQTEAVYIAAVDLRRYAQVAAEDVQKVELPKRRAEEMAVLRDSPVGQWARVRVPAGTLLNPAMLTDVPPERRVIGEVLLPVGWRGYVLVVQTPLTRELVPGDLVDLVMVQDRADEGLLLLQKVPLLKLEKKEGQTTATLALQVEQAVVLDAYLAPNGARGQASETEAVRPLLLLSQAANPDLPALTRYDLRRIAPEFFQPIGPAEGWEGEGENGP